MDCLPEIDIEKFAPSLPEGFSTPLAPVGLSFLQSRWGITAAVPLEIINQRLDRLVERGSLDGTHVLRAIVLEDVEYRKWLSERKSVFEIAGQRAYLWHVLAQPNCQATAPQLR